MSASDAKQVPALWHAPKAGPDIEHHTQEWTSGTMGGGKVPADYEWTSNPRVCAEENGANLPPHQVPTEQILPDLPKDTKATKT